MTELRLRDDVLWRQAGAEVVALDSGASKYLSTNAPGALLWKTLADGATRGQLVQQLVSTYGIEIPRAEADVDAFLSDLAAGGLLRS